MSNFIGALRYSDPRAVQVREPENTEAVHTATHCDVAVYTDNRLQTEALLARWAEIMQVAADKAAEILAGIESEPDEGTE